MKQKLLTILVCLASAFIALALTLQNPSEDEVDLPSPRIVIIGSTGVGKSSLANVFIGESPLCSNCTFPICNDASSCTKETTYAVGQWLGTGPMFTVVDTPGFGDSDQDDSVLVDEMMTVLKDTVKSANALLLVFKGDQTRLDGPLQQMLREMKSLFGDDLWKHVVIGVSFWSFTQSDINSRNRTCTNKPEFCHDEQWFRTIMSKELEDKFHIGQELQFAFIDSWSQTDDDHEDIEHESFERESSILWNFAQSSEEFVFKSIQDVLDENDQLKNEVKYLKGIIETNITEILRVQDILMTTTAENAEDIINLRIHQSHSDGIAEETSKTVEKHSTQILENAENISANEENIKANRENIQINLQNIFANQVNIDTNKQNIDTNKQNIDTNMIGIVQNEREIQSLDSKHQDLSESFKRSNLKFHADTIIWQSWPVNTDVTYVSELVDTHNAFNPGTGTFTAPFDGTYGFIFYADFRSDNGNLYAYHNSNKINVFWRYSEVNTDNSSSVYFALHLKQNDRVKINAGTSDISNSSIPAKFLGFLLQ